jgi:inward rectifier potassium channel
MTDPVGLEAEPKIALPAQPPESKLRDDLGIGRIAAERGRGRFLDRRGRFNSRREGLGMAAFSPYYWLLSVSWPVFLLVALSAFLLLNLLFAALYLALGADALASSVSMTPFQRAFFFSVETLSTIGYGHITPRSLEAHWLSSLQAFVGVLSVAILTGLMFAKFSKPTARILFSRNALIAPFQGGTALMLRVTNGLKNEIIEINAQVTLSRQETVNGAMQRRFYPLKLERSSVVFFPLAWTIVHPITPDSPLWGVDERALLDSGAELLVVLHGVDDVLYQRIHARTSFGAEDVVWNARFSDIYVNRQDGALRIDARRLSQYETVTLASPARQ